ncbi:MAG: SIS domain-containing protein [bacterium]|nr:MAG: SIS domain-containing protein [bacterium]
MAISNHDGSSTYTEIKRQQKLWKTALDALTVKKEEYEKLLTCWHDRTWVFSGCGTSFYLAQTASHLFGEETLLPVKAVPASEILISPRNVFNVNQKNLLIALSRSGTTTEIVKAVLKAKKEFGIPSLAVSCDQQSTMSVSSDFRLQFPFLKEKSVVMTGSFTTMLISIIFLASLKQSKDDSLPDLYMVADQSEQVMNGYEDLVREIANLPEITNYVFLGQGTFYGIANEAGLKMQEMSLSPAQSYHSLEYRHGPMSTADASTLITILCSQSGAGLDAQLVNDLKKLGSKILVMGDGLALRDSCKADYKVTLPHLSPDGLNSLLVMPLLQLLGFYKAKAKDMDPDQPKNLSAVVELNL